MRKICLTLLLAVLATLLFGCDVEVHVHTWGEPEVAGNGDMIYTCTGCSKTKTVTQTPTHIHTWGEPAVGANGEKIYTCAECGETKTEAQTHTHTFENTYGFDADRHWNPCVQSGCSEKGNVQQHTWDAGTVTKEPSVSAQGERTYACTACGYKKTEAIEKLAAAPLAKMPLTAWEAAFSFENVKVEYVVPEDEEDIPIYYLIDGDLAQIVMEDGAIYADPYSLIEEFDFAAYYEDFACVSENVYAAERIEQDALLVCVDVEVIFADGKIRSICYAYEGEEDVHYNYSFSEWDEIEIAVPTLTAADLAAAFAPANFENYTLGVVAMTLEPSILYMTTWQFDGADFGCFIFDEEGNMEPQYGSEQNAGWVKIPELAVLAATLDADDFVYDAEAGGFTAEVTIENFMGEGVDVVGVCLMIEDGYPISVVLIREDGVVLSYYFTEYGTTEIETVEELIVLSAQELESALAPDRFENYTYTYAVITAANRVSWRECWEFDGKAYHSCTYDNTGDMINDEYQEIAAGVAGWDCVPILWELAQSADAFVFVYDADVGYFYSEINDPTAFGGGFVEMYLLVEDGYLTYLELVNESGIRLVYTFAEYGTTEIVVS